MRDIGDCLVVVVGVLGTVISFMAIMFVWSDARAQENCLKFGEVSGLEVETSNTYCFINDPELGWITYQERLESRTAERGLNHEGS
jgi:hypothetical protein